MSTALDDARAAVARSDKAQGTMGVGVTRREVSEIRDALRALIEYVGELEDELRRARV